MLGTDIFKLIFHNVLNKITYMYGVEYQAHDFQLSVRTLISFLMLFMYVIGEVYTCLSKEYTLVLKSLATFAPWLECLYKFYLFYSDRQMLREKTEYVHELYVQCERNPVAHEICNRWARRFLVLCKLYGSVLGGSGIGFLLSPVTGYMMLHMWDVPVLATAFPGIDYDTAFGYRLMYAINAVTVPVSTVGMFCTDLVIFMLMLHVCPMSDVFVSKLAELQRSLERGLGKAGDRVTQEYLYNIVRLHQEVCVFMDDMTALTYLLFLIDVMLDGLSMCFSIFVLMSLQWMPLYGLLSIYVTKLFVACSMGTLVEVHTDHILDGLLQFKWYLLRHPHKKLYMQMVQRSQNQSVLVAGTMPLNMELFVGVMKNTYTFAMFLMNMM